MSHFNHPQATTPSLARFSAQYFVLSEDILRSIVVSKSVNILKRYVDMLKVYVSTSRILVDRSTLKATSTSDN